jgi:hypothetical protein
MLNQLRRRLATASIAVAVLMLPVSASADVIDPVNCVTHPTNPACVIQIGDPGGPGGSGSSSRSGCRNQHGVAIPCHIPGKGWYGGDGCWYQRAEGNALAAAEALGGTVIPPRRWYVGSCGDPITNFWPATLVRFRVYGLDPGVELLAQEAIRHLNLPRPAIHLNPDSAPKDPSVRPVPQVVFVPTWLWIDPVVWAPRSATASIAGLSVTAVGTPTRVTWATGDGGRTDCGRGTPWQAGTDPRRASPDCGHTYTTASRTAAGGRYTVTATITWQVTWTGGGTSGTEPALTSTASVPVPVIESAAVNT